MNRGFCCATVFCATLFSALGLSINCQGAERPTFNKGTCDPRPDILPSWLLDWTIGEYRRAYNRPRFVAGWLAHAVEPSSQEAMVWCEAHKLGLYQKPHCPPMCKQFYVPKPWEVLNTGPRPDFAKSKPVAEPNKQPTDDERDHDSAGHIEENTAKVHVAEAIFAENQ